MAKKAAGVNKTTVDFFAITETAKKGGGRERTPALLPLDQQLAVTLETQFESMADEFFLENPTVVEFDGRYKPDKGEVFVIYNFQLDPALAAAVRNTIGTPELNLSRSPFPQIKAIVASKVNSPLRIIFQEFKTDQIIRQGWAIVQKVLAGKSTFDRIDYSGIAIGSDIDAVYDNGTLYFRSYYTANRFADLTPHFKDATNEDIKELLASTTSLVAEDEATLLDHTDTAMRRKFAIIKQTGILDVVSPEQVLAAAAEHGIIVDVQADADGNKQIVIPNEKGDARDLLDFLCQARFFSALTKELMVANSYRPVLKKTPAKSPPDPQASPPKKAAKKTAKKKAAKKAAKKAPKKS